MKNEDLYIGIENNELKLPSEMGVFPSEKKFVFSQTQIENALRNNESFTLSEFEVLNIRDEEKEVITQKYKVTVKYNESDYDISLVVLKAEMINLENFGLGNQISQEEYEQAIEQEYYLESSMFFSDSAIESFHLQLKILDSIVSQASIVIDFMPARLLSGKWLHTTTQSNIPPSPSYLYTIHGVYEGENEDNRIYWLHTHGLHRCGSVELEMINIKEGVQQLNGALNMIATMFIQNRTRKKENEIFDVGYDGLGLTFCWQRWENSIAELSENTPGNINDRGENDIHSGPAGILFAVQENLTTSPEIYANTLAENPVYFISDEETERMAALAKERFQSFKNVFKKENKTPKKSLLGFFKKENEKNDWKFLVKLGLTIDSGDEKEHLWFEVNSIDENNFITGELINQPYWISKLKAGDINSYPVEILTDWIIYAPDNTYSPDNIYMIV